ncbi:MAG: signal peptidase II [Legionellaceae bacterium]
MKKFLAFMLSVCILALDQLTKYWALKALSPYEPVSVVPFLNWTLSYNTGAAFSFLGSTGAWHLWFFMIFSALMSCYIAVWMVRKTHEHALELYGLSCVLGGALGNLVDRLLHGYVVDFIAVYYKTYHFAVFNVADSAITLGGFFLILSWSIKPKKAPIVLDR